MTQVWSELLFVHWQFPASLIQKMLPPGLHVHTFAGEAYVGVVSFAMSQIRPFYFPALPMVSKSLELNLRTYVFDNQKNPGVWFFSLDASSPLLVMLARRFFHLPYFKAHQQMQTQNNFSFKSKRVGYRQQNQLEFQPGQKSFLADPGSLDFFLTSRFLLFSWNHHKSQLYKGRIYHDPYQLKNVELLEFDTHLFSMDGLPEPIGQPDHVIYCPGAEVNIFTLQKI